MKMLVTAPIFYVNGAPHLGHFYTAVLCDFIARFYRLKGNEVIFSIGTDEHGQKVANAAQNARINVHEYVNSASKAFKNLFDEAHISYSVFIRTTSLEHKKSALALWNAIDKNGFFYEGYYQGWYSIDDEAFVTDSEVKFTGIPTEDSKALSTEGKYVVYRKERCIYFRLSAFKDELLEAYEFGDGNKHLGRIIVSDETRKAIIALLKRDVPDLAVSRLNCDWGIPIPNTDYKMYVWVDALANYLTAVGYPEKTIYEINQSEEWNESIHVIGKDISKFHAIYWPALLLAAGFKLPKRILVHGWWLVEGEKMSKSLNNVLDPHKLLDEYGEEELRFLLLSEMNIGSDGNFSDQHMHQRLSTELKNSWGNLVQRVFKMCEDKVIYKPTELADHETIQSYSVLEKMRSDTKDFVTTLDMNAKILRVNYPEIATSIDNITQAIKKLFVHSSNVHLSFLKDFETDISDCLQLYMGKFLRVQEYIKRVQKMISDVNAYFSTQEPWKKEDKMVILYVACDCIRKIAALFLPVMPTKSKQVLDMMGYEYSYDFKNLLEDNVSKFHIRNVKQIFPSTNLES